MLRHANRVFLLSFRFYLVSVLIVTSIFWGHFASADVVEGLETDVFTFVRLKYRGSWRHRGKWDTDWPASDRNFILQLREQTNVAVGLADSFYPHELSDMAFKMGINAVIYSLTH